jgi:hypothetical protein
MKIRVSDSVWSSTEQKAARPDNGRPLQNPAPKMNDGFVAADPFRAFRNGSGIFMVKVNHHQIRAGLGN